MAKKICEICQDRISSVMYFGVNLCNDCHTLYLEASSGDADARKIFCDPISFPKATARAKSAFIDVVIRREKSRQAEEAAVREKLVLEQQHQEFAKSFNEFYEYDVVTIINHNHGTIDREHMMRVLTDYATRGWRLHSVYSNELGKNALSVLGYGVNSTACEDVLIFERRVQKL